MTDMLTDPILVLVDLEAPADAPGGLGAAQTTDARPTGPALDLLAGARHLTSGEVVALVLGTVGADASALLAAAGATRLLAAELEGAQALAGVAADALVAAVRRVRPAAALVVSDYRGKELAGRAAVVLGSAATCDVAEVEVRDGALHASRLVLSGSWSTTMRLTSSGEAAPVLAVRPGAFAAAGIAGGDLDREVRPEPLAVEVLDPAISPQSLSVRLVSREQASVASGPDLVQARTVVVGGRGVDGDFDLVHSLADPLGAAVGATRVACDEGWIESSAQIGQTGLSIAPRLYIGLGVSGAVHHTSGIQGAGTIVAVCDDSEAPIFEMADYGVVGDVREVVPQLVEELARLRD